MQTRNSALRHFDELDELNADEIAHELSQFPDWAEAIEAARKPAPNPPTDDEAR